MSDSPAAAAPLHPVDFGASRGAIGDGERIIASAAWTGGVFLRRILRALVRGGPDQSGALSARLGPAVHLIVYHFVAEGDPTMRYPATWRMQLATDRLRNTNASLAPITETVGYESEAAFSRAFKKAFGTAPTTRRRAHSRERPTFDARQGISHC